MAQVGLLLLLDWAVVVGFVAAALFLESTGIELPQQIEDDWTLAEMVFYMVIVAPPLEELMFRGGLSGQRRSIILSLAPWLLLAMLWGVFLVNGGLSMNAFLILSLGWLVSTAVIAARHWRDFFVPDRFRQLFPSVFWLTSGLFGFMHVFNYEDPSSLAALFMVIPQFTGGMMLAYVRVKFGMWANIAQHVTHNAVAVALYYAWPSMP